MAANFAWISPYLDWFKHKFIQTLISSAIIIGSSILCTVSSYYFYKLRYPPMPSVHYTKTGDLNKNNGILVFIHGYPDHEYLWKDQVKFFNKKNYCCITLEIPNFHPDRVGNPWGYDISIIVKALANTLKQILNDKEFILVGHDWGSLLANIIYLEYKTEINVSKLILVDVADGSDPDPTQKHKYLYAFKFVIFFLMPSFIGTYFLRNLLLKWIHDPLITSPVVGGIVPILDQEKKDNKSYIFSESLYLYYYGKKSKLIRNITGSGKRKSMTQRLNEFDGLPILFIDGNKGDDPTRFYTPTFREFIEKRDYCTFEQFDESGHWIMVEQSEKLNNTIYQFINS